MPFCFLLGLSSMLLTRRFQRLGDLAAGTMVVVEEPQARSGLVRVQEPAGRAVLALAAAADRRGPEPGPGAFRLRPASRPVRPGPREEMAEPLARPLRARFGLPAGEPADAVLCAVYHRVFLGE